MLEQDENRTVSAHGTYMKTGVFIGRTSRNWIYLATFSAMTRITQMLTGTHIGGDYWATLSTQQ